MLVALAIISILSTLAILTYSNYRKHLQVKSTADSVNALLATSRTYAISHNGYFQAVIDLDDGSFWIDEVTIFGNLVTPKLVTPEKVTNFVRIVDVEVLGVVHTTGIVRLLFRPEGSSDYAKIHVLGEKADPAFDDNYFTVVLYSSTGRAKVFPHERR